MCVAMRPSLFPVLHHRYGPPKGPNLNAPNCTSCEAGKYAAAGGATACASCVAGRYQHASGQFDCDVCPAFTAQTNSGATSCHACGAGKEPVHDGLSGVLPTECAPLLDQSDRMALDDLRVSARACLLGAKNGSLCGWISPVDPRSQISCARTKAGATRIISVALRGCGIYALPESVGNLTELRYLDFSNNKLTVLPVSFDRLSQLQTLVLINNNFGEVPRLTSLRALTQVRFRDNYIKSLPDSLQTCRGLVQLDLAGNMLGSLPHWIERLDQLRYLDVSRNHLHTLPSTISNLTSLLSLKLDGNQLNLVPASLLVRLFRTRNNETTLPAIETLTLALSREDAQISRTEAVPYPVRCSTRASTCEFALVFRNSANDRVNFGGLHCEILVDEILNVSATDHKNGQYSFSISMQFLSVGRHKVQIFINGFAPRFEKGPSLMIVGNCACVCVSLCLPDTNCEYRHVVFVSRSNRIANSISSGGATGGLHKCAVVEGERRRQAVRMLKWLCAQQGKCFLFEM